MNRRSFAVNAPAWLCLTSPHYAAKPTSNYEAKEKTPEQIAAAAARAEKAKVAAEIKRLTRDIGAEAAKAKRKARNAEARDALSKRRQAERKKTKLTPEEREAVRLAGYRRWRATQAAAKVKRKPRNHRKKKAAA